MILLFQTVPLVGGQLILVKIKTKLLFVQINGLYQINIKEFHMKKMDQNIKKLISIETNTKTDDLFTENRKWISSFSKDDGNLRFVT